MKPLLWDSTETDPWTGQPYTRDSPNPNVTWDGILETGDPGYTPPPASFSNRNRQRASKMKHNSYYPDGIPEQLLWLANFFNKLPAVVPVLPGALQRIFSLVQVIQEAPAYTDSIATDLGTLGSEDTAPDFNTLQPLIKAVVRADGVFIDWNWGGQRAHLSMIQLQVDRGQGWTDLAFDTTPGYLDT
ncbi:MAG TPA: hypothetical protein PK490_21850, partial [Prosthecobacter sp.]|nr:hypothetical protein [Prosthecobacter sp.]